MRLDKMYCWGFVLVHTGGEFVIPQSETSLEHFGRKSGASLTDESIEEIVTEVNDEDLIVLPVLSGKRVEGIFCRLDLGGYWSEWVWGEDMEEVLEQLDDLYGVYEDYL